MGIRCYLFLSAILASVNCSGEIARKPPPSQISPNVIYILADDLGYGDLGSYGQKRIETPHLDRMAEGGMRFTQHYAGSTVCAPSRASLMTGVHTGHASVRGNVELLIRPDEITLAEVMKKAGYATAAIGKWGIGHPPPPDDPQRNGFDHFFGYLSMWHAHNSYPEFLWRDQEVVSLNNVVEHPEEYYRPSQRELVGWASKKIDYSNDLFTQKALDFLDQQDEPFFLYLAYTIPHANNEGPAFGGPGMEVPELGQYSERDWPGAEKRKAAMITRLDGYVGQILESLQNRGLDQQTLVIFSSDNGPHREGGVDPDFFESNGRLRGIKRDLYEGGIRVPMIAHWPGTVQPGSESHHVSAFWDILPTLADLVNQPVDHPVDGISFLPELLGEKQPQHEYLYWEFHERGSKQAVRMGNWKGLRLSPASPLELYDLDTDSSETHDVASDHPKVVKQIESVLKTARDDSEEWPLNPSGQ